MARVELGHVLRRHEVVDERARLGVGDEGAAADMGGELLALDAQVVGAPDGADGDAEAVGELALRRQLGPAREAALGDRRGDGVGEGAIARAGAVPQVVRGYCHGAIGLLIL